MKLWLSSVSKAKNVILSSIFAAVVVFMISCEMQPPKDSFQGQAVRGKAHFDKYCASCHGEDAKGIVIDSLDTQPADLTRIMASRGVSEFPVKPIARMIDGRQLEGVHGPRAMPVWGKVLQAEGDVNESEFKGTLGELIAYLMTIQKS